MSNPLTGFSGFPRSPSEKNLTTRRAINRLAATTGKFASNVFANITVPGGNTIANTVTETAFASVAPFPANVLAPSNALVVRARGVYSSTAGPTLRLKVKLGTTTLLDTTAITLANNGAVSLWTLDALVILAAVGASGNVEAQGVAWVFPVVGPQALPLVNAAVVSLDTTVALNLSLTAQWGTASAGNTITLRQLLAELLP